MPPYCALILLIQTAAVGHGGTCICSYQVERPTLAPEVVQQLYRNSQYVFIGVVDSIRDDPDAGQDADSIDGVPLIQSASAMYISVEQTWRPLASRKIVIRQGNTSCDVLMWPGRRYLVFANRWGRRELPYTSRCSGTRAVEELQDELHALGPPSLK